MVSKHHYGVKRRKILEIKIIHKKYKAKENKSKHKPKKKQKQTINKN
jgi:hypothetical protein